MSERFSRSWLKSYKPLKYSENFFRGKYILSTIDNKRCSNFNQCQANLSKETFLLIQILAKSKEVENKATSKLVWYHKKRYHSKEKTGALLLVRKNEEDLILDQFVNLLGDRSQNAIRTMKTSIIISPLVEDRRLGMVKKWLQSLVFRTKM